ncbi:MAG: 4Fe-4S double cluster binding domain-containing protein [Eubacteriales bacterium]|nr:4Fe-4S double cluster binding domain-containing protein [Eubacteriales bacterium]MDD4476233.1 4Fe-4S double cluster binding domain-containing protein [Eubacteriales bacterium]
MKVTDTIEKILKDNGIEEFAFVKTSELKIINQRLLNNVDYQTCILFIIPYNTRDNKPTFISKYSVPRDYHLFSSQLFNAVIPKLEEKFPNEIFKGFADASPYNERDAIAKSGIGFIGDNGLVINERYGSFVFIAEIVTTIVLPVEEEDKRRTECAHCGKCFDSCPTGALPLRDYTKCLSYISQKKQKTEDDYELIYKHGTAWGCDLCQTCCVHNEKAEYSQIPFFNEKLINTPTASQIEEMSDEEFSERAYSWRGRGVITKNLEFFEAKRIESKNRC